MAPDTPDGPKRSLSGNIKAVLGPTNTGKTHLAVERLCAHSSGAIGFPLRLLAREIYDRVCAIKGAHQVALITGEQRIEPKDARWLLCTVEAMPVSADLAFVGLDEAQLSADRDRGHIFTDRLLHARGREETMILGAETLAPMIRSLLPDAEIVSRPRFSTLTHAGAMKLSRVPPRSAIVAFSAEEVYAIAEMLRRFRGGAAVVMGALSPQTRNAQVELYQSGEVDYIVATDAIGMGLNLDVSHVAFAGLSKFDGVRRRRLTVTEMAQIAGRAGRHQRDGTFGTLAGTGRLDAELTEEEVHSIEEHRFPALQKLYWREAEPRTDDLATLISDLEAPPDEDGLAAAPEAIDLAVLKRLSDEPDIAATVTTPRSAARFWEVCSLPDFQQQGVEHHARFVSRLWQDLQGGELRTDYFAQSVAQLDNVSGDIDTLQGRIAAIRSWAYIAQRENWVRDKDEMAARARAVEGRLSDALHSRLTERFINRRTAVLMRKLGPDAGMLPVSLDGDDVLVDGEHIGSLDGFAFRVDSSAPHSDRKLLFAAAERHVPALLAGRASALAENISEGTAILTLDCGSICWEGQKLASLQRGRKFLEPRIVPDHSLAGLNPSSRDTVMAALESWLVKSLDLLETLTRLEAGSEDPKAGPELRALLIRLVEAGGTIERRHSDIYRLDKEQRGKLGRLGVKVGALDIFVPAMLKPAALELWRELALTWRSGSQPDLPASSMPPVLAVKRGKRPLGYRKAGKQLIRVEMAEKLLRKSHEERVAAGKKEFALSPALAISMGLTGASFAHLLRLAGFRPIMPKQLAENAHGPPAPVRWRWRAGRRRSPQKIAPAYRESGAFAALAELVG